MHSVGPYSRLVPESGIALYEPDTSIESKYILEQSHNISQLTYLNEIQGHDYYSTVIIYV